jgi:replicative DNA helicase
MVSDLRDCGDLEQDADHVLLVQRPCKYEEWERHQAAMWVKEGKGRHGRVLE